MIRKAIGFVVFWLVGAGGVAPAQEPEPRQPPAGMPRDAGVYYREASGKWAKLEPARVEDSRMKGMDVFLRTEGLAGLDVSFSYPGAQAAFRLSEPRPTFYIRGVGSEREALIVLLTKKKESRTARTTSTAAASGNKAGFSRGSVRRVAVAPFSDGTFSVSPDEDLKPGEYLLVFGSAAAGFDFGIGAAARPGPQPN